MNVLLDRYETKHCFNCSFNAKKIIIYEEHHWLYYLLMVEIGYNFTNKHEIKYI